MKYTIEQIENTIRKWQAVLDESCNEDELNEVLGLSLLTHKDKADSKKSYMQFIRFLNTCQKKFKDKLNDYTFEIYIGQMDEAHKLKMKNIDIVKHMGENGVIIFDVDGGNVIKEDDFSIDEVDMAAVGRRRMQDIQQKNDDAKKRHKSQQRKLKKEHPDFAPEQIRQQTKDQDVSDYIKDMHKQDYATGYRNKDTDKVSYRKKKGDEGSILPTNTKRDSVMALKSALKYNNIKKMSKQLGGVALNCRQAHNDKMKHFFNIIDINYGEYKNIISTVIEKCKVEGNVIKMQFRATNTMQHAGDEDKADEEMFSE